MSEATGSLKYSEQTAGQRRQPRRLDVKIIGCWFDALSQVSQKKKPILIETGKVK
jgi:hypothetical protein